ncbi:MAG: NERD domain-containing protein [Gammaproteobacteria bacterium]|nr:NERD domain-containing protein [Gammaproteobacteria bacterium]
MIINNAIWYGLIPVGIILILFIIFSKSIKSWYQEYCLRKTIKQFGHDVLHNVIVPDGMDGTVFIENLVLTAKEIIVISFGYYKGVIFAADNIDVWTQVFRNRSYRFSNPLLKLEQETAAVRAHLPRENIHNFILYTKGAEFPKGKPENVLSLEEARERFSNKDSSDVNTELLSAWNTLKQVAIVEN